MGALVTTNPAPGSPPLNLPWIITIGPFGGDEDWEPLVCGPYERGHALALAKAVVENDDLMAVVEPVAPYLGADHIRREVAEARAVAARTAFDDEFDAALAEPEDARPERAEYPPDRVALDDAAGGPPTPAEVREGLARIAQRLCAIDVG